MAWNNWQNALGIHCQNAAVAPTIIETTTTTYTLRGNSGRFLEAEAEASTLMMPNLRAGLWVAGSWLEIDGTGRVNSSVLRSDDFVIVPGTRDISDSSYTRSYVATGIVLGLGF
jgi:hypothetical protein